MSIQEQLDKKLQERERLYNKGCNDEKLNDKIRQLQKLIRDEKSNI
jgi:hypothetical protein